MKKFARIVLLIIIICIPAWESFSYIIDRGKREARDRMYTESDSSSLSAVALVIKQHNRSIDPYRLYLSDEVDIRHFISQKDRESREFVNKWLQNKHDQKIPENIFNTLCVLKIDYDANRNEVTIRSQAVPGRVKTISLKTDSAKPN